MIKKKSRLGKRLEIGDWEDKEMARRRADIGEKSKKAEKEGRAC